ncbi:PH and SEC7 domain-containing protein 3-like [Platysternon megacephalum]|uniref:PH and SEC7 domain-containing protein 3-like n=1 Tax=Platysternon megacephalum TaxID=55544 RepID=A0A4D9DXU6_9SAUR|nr:PH and SEC7 domain-containing protein 3-like [Platysternon megacephalum]
MWSVVMPCFQDTLLCHPRRCIESNLGSETQSSPALNGHADECLAVLPPYSVQHWQLAPERRAGAAIGKPPCADGFNWSMVCQASAAAFWSPSLESSYRVNTGLNIALKIAICQLLSPLL